MCHELPSPRAVDDNMHIYMTLIPMIRETFRLEFTDSYLLAAMKIAAFEQLLWGQENRLPMSCIVEVCKRYQEILENRKTTEKWQASGFEGMYLRDIWVIPARALLQLQYVIMGSLSITSLRAVAYAVINRQYFYKELKMEVAREILIWDELRTRLQSKSILSYMYRSAVEDYKKFLESGDEPREASTSL
jgi:hypothetical protein